MVRICSVSANCLPKKKRSPRPVMDLNERYIVVFYSTFLVIDEVFMSIELNVFCFCHNAGVISFQNTFPDSDVVLIIFQQILSSVVCPHDIC